MKKISVHSGEIPAKTESEYFPADCKKKIVFLQSVCMQKDSRIAAFFGECPRSCKQTAATHISRGVRYNIAEDGLRARFWASLQSDAQDNLLYSVHEIPGSTFQMFFKLNFSLSERLCDMTVCEFARVVHATMERFYPDKTTLMIPGFFEQVWMEAAPARQCATPSELMEFIAKKPLLTDGVAIKIVDGAVQMVDGSRIAPLWLTPPPRVDGMTGIYKIRVSGDTVTLDARDTPQFENPKTYSEACAKALRYTECPANAVSIEEERRNMISCRPSAEYTADTVFDMEDGSFFQNMLRVNGRLSHELYVTFPELIVNIDQALTMREALVANMTVSYGPTNDNFAPDGWHKVVDATAYTSDGPGLRVYGSQNTTDCACAGKRSCHRDCKNGKIYCGERMVLRSVFIDGLRRDDYEDHYHQQVSLIIKRGSIQTAAGAPTTPGWARYHGAPQYLEEVKTLTTKKGDTLTSLRCHPGGGQRRTTFKSDRPVTRVATTLVTDASVINALQTAIRTRFVRKYARLCVTSVQATLDHDTIFVSVSGEGQHYCLNLNPCADHASNTIYFQCDRNGICQRCRCSDPTTDGRRKGPCKSFKSRVLPLTRVERDVIFGAHPSPSARQTSGKRER